MQQPNFIERKGVEILRVSVGAVFLWFGFLKFFDSSSPAEQIASETISLITFGLIDSNISMPLLATLECVIGIGLLVKRLMRFAIPILYFQMAGTLLPLVIFRSQTWSDWLVPTLLGQYIIKNAVLISAGIVLGVVSKGGRLIADPVVAEEAKKVEEERE